MPATTHSCAGVSLIEMNGNPPEAISIVINTNPISHDQWTRIGMSKSLPMRMCQNTPNHIASQR